MINFVLGVVTDSLLELNPAKERKSWYLHLCIFHFLPYPNDPHVMWSLEKFRKENESDESVHRLNPDGKCSYLTNQLHNYGRSLIALHMRRLLHIAFARICVKRPEERYGLEAL